MSLPTAAVTIGKVAEFVPAATWTLAGTLATDGFELDRATSAPEGGAGPESVTVPVEPFPPTTEEGLVDSAEGGGRSAYDAVRVSGDAGAITVWVAAPPSDQETNS